MNKEQILKLLMLLSALESWGFSNKTMFPDYLHEKLSECIDELSKRLLDKQGD